MPGKEEPADTDMSESNAAELHYRAYLGDRIMIQKMLEKLGEKFNDNMDDPLIKAYYADCISLNARYSNDTAQLFGSGIKAMKMLDEAVDAAPGRIEIRLLRAIQGYRLPESFFRRSATIISDLEYVIHEYNQDHTILSKNFYTLLQYMLGKAYQRLGMKNEAEEAWKGINLRDCNPELKAWVEKELAAAPVEYNLPADSASLDAKALFAEGKRLHDSVMDGDFRFARKACEVLEAAYGADQNDPLIEAYYGSSVGLASKHSNDSQELFGSAIKGLKLINHAVEAAPENPEIRFLRAYFYYSLPEAFFHSSDKAISDFNFLISKYDETKIFSQELYWQLLYDLGNCYERIGNMEEAKKTWNKLLKINPDPQYLSLLRGKLERSEVE